MTVPESDFHVSGLHIRMPADGTSRTVTFSFSDGTDPVNVDSSWTVVALTPRAGADLATVVGTGDGTDSFDATFTAAMVNQSWALRHGGQERAAGKLVPRSLAPGAPSDDTVAVTVDDAGSNVAITITGAAAGGSSVTVSDTAPTSPTEGDQWFDSDSGSLFTYVDGAWVETGAEGLGTLLDDILATGIPSYLDLAESADVTNPAADHYRLIARTDGMYVRDPAGDESGPLGEAAVNDFPRFTSITAEEWGQPGPYASGHNTLIAAGRATWTLVWADAGPVDQISVWAATTGTCTYRLCIDSLGDDGWPDTLLLDCGTLDMSTGTGIRSIAIAWTCPASGWYWGRVQTDAHTSDATTSGLNGAVGNPWPPLPGWPTQAAFLNRSYTGLASLAQTTGAGQQPNPTILTGNVPRVWLRKG